jgi:hypothetical protein
MQWDSSIVKSVLFLLELKIKNRRYVHGSYEEDICCVN